MTTLDHPTQIQTPNAESAQLSDALCKSAHRVRNRILMRSLLRWTGSSFGFLALMIGTDYLFRLSIPARCVLFVVFITFVVIMYKRWVHAATALRLSPSDLALSLPSQETALAAAVDLPRDDTTDPIESALLEAVRERSTRHVDQDAARAPMRTRVFHEMLGISILITLGAIIAMMQPSVLSIGARRVLLPMSDIKWPMRFGITIDANQAPHPSDRAFVASAQIGPSTDDPDARLRWRLIDEQRNEVVPWTTLGMNRQRSIDHSELAYEQLIPIHTISSTQFPEGARLEYRITSRDDQSTVQRIEIIHPPKLTAVSATITLPAYARSIDENEQFLDGIHTLDITKLALGPILEGSQVTLDWSFDAPISSPNTQQVSENTVQQSRSFEAPTSVSIDPVDVHGFEPRSPSDVYLRVVPDAPPTAMITSPSTDLVVGPRAEIDFAARIMDDLGLVHASYIRELDELEETISTIDATGTRESEMDLYVDLEQWDVSPGDQVTIQISATDIKGLDGRSPSRVLRIVEDQEIIERVESRLGSIGEILRRLDDQQRELINLVPDIDPRDQHELAQQINERMNSVRNLQEELKQSKIDDPQLSPMLHAIEESLQDAQESATEAAQSLERKQNDQATQRMERVRDELGNSIAMLDRGQDTWLARRAISDLKSSVQELNDQTNKFAQQTGGKSLDQLSEDERSMLEKILDKQRRVTQQARQTIDELDEQAQALDEKNPTGAQGIRGAVSKGRSAGIEEQLAQAGEELSQNQTSSASGTQQQVLEDLDEMLEQIDQAQRNRDSALRRKLASIMDSINAIIEDQTLQLERLNNSENNLDDSMIALRSNTLAVRDEASAAFPETQSIADSLTSATEAQESAINALRETPINTTNAQQFELAALTHLQAALEEAQKQDQQAADRQARRLRDELRAKYKSSLEIQNTITDQTDPLVGNDLNRRQRAAARDLGRQESTLREELAQMLEQTEELSEAPIFSLAHDQLDALLISIESGLSERSIQPMLIEDQHATAMILSALIDVLGQSQQAQQDDFEDGQSGGGGGQGGGGAEEPVIPPLAQLQLLRSLQQLTATQTRAVSEMDSPDPDRLNQIGKLQRDLAQKGQELIESMNPNQPADEEQGEEE